MKLAEKAQFDELKKQLSAQISQILSGHADVVSSGIDLDPEAVYDLLVEPPQKEMGDLALGMFLLAKALKSSPPII